MRWLPDVPTVKETGALDYEVTGWNAIFAPAGTPPDVVAKLNSEIVAIMAMPDIRNRSLVRKSFLKGLCVLEDE